MKHAICAVLSLLLLGLTAGAQEKSATTSLAPLIDREIIFGNPEIAAAQISPNGQYIAFLKPWKETRNLYVKAIGEPFSAARLLTTEAKRPILGYFSRPATVPFPPVNLSAGISTPAPLSEHIRRFLQRGYRKPGS